MKPRLRAALTRPEAEQVLRVARLDGAHGAVLDTHNGAFCVERHCVDTGWIWCCVVVESFRLSVTVRLRLRQREQ